jgi:predicted DsbA family dithiol-disulfide isomerase
MDTQIVRPETLRPALELDLIADFACPWSYLGKRSLERALGSLYGAPVRPLRWHGFRSQSEQATAKVSWPEHLAIRLPKGVTVDFAQRGLADAGRELGIGFNFDRLQSLPDTREAHRLTALAVRDERQGEVVEGLFKAFFEEGRDIAETKVLTDIARECGLSAATLAAFADPAEGRDQVAAEEQRLRGLGVTATPNLLINGRVLVPGPADVSTYIQALDHALFPALSESKDKQLLH